MAEEEISFEISTASELRYWLLPHRRLFSRPEAAISFGTPVNRRGRHPL